MRALALAALLWCAPAALAWPAGPLRLSFEVDDAVLIHEVCGRGAIPGAPADDIVDLQSAMWAVPGAAHRLLSGDWEPEDVAARPFVEEVRALPAYARVRAQAESRRFYCESEWESDRAEATRFVQGLTGVAPRGRYRVEVLHPSLAGGANLGGHRIRWGGREDFPHYTTVYMWHEVLHDVLPHDALGHVLVQLVTDQELRCRLDPAADRAKYVGHPELEAMTQRVAARWERYRRQPRRDILALYRELEGTPGAHRRSMGDLTIGQVGTQSRRRSPEGKVTSTTATGTP